LGKKPAHHSLAHTFPHFEAEHAHWFQKLFHSSAVPGLFVSQHWKHAFAVVEPAHGPVGVVGIVPASMPVPVPASMPVPDPALLVGFGGMGEPGRSSLFAAWLPLLGVLEPDFFPELLGNVLLCRSFGISGAAVQAMRAAAIEANARTLRRITTMVRCTF